MLPLPRILTLATTAIVLAASAEECDVDSGTHNTCRMKVEITARSQRVIAGARAECAPPPQSHDFHLELEMLADEPDVWDHRKSDASSRIPRPGHSVRLHADTGCYPGTYRATAVARGKGPDGRTFEAQDSASEYFSLDDCRRRPDG